jgi:hypothetical protein
MIGRSRKTFPGTTPLLRNKLMRNGTKAGRRTRALVRFTVVLVVLNLTWRTVRYALGFPIWGDEAFVAMNLLNRGFAGMIDPLEYGQIVPLGFMWAELAITRFLGVSQWALRLLPFLLGVASMLAFWRWAEHMLDRRTALLAVGVFAASYYPVRHAAELKPYAGDLLLSLVLIWLGWSVYQQPNRLGRWMLLILTAAVGFWLSYPLVFVAGGVGLLLTYLAACRRSARVFGLWLTYGLCTIISFAAMYFTYARPHARATWPADAPWTMETWGEGFPPLANPSQLPLWLLDVHTGNMLAYPEGGVNGGSSLTTVLVLIGAVSIWRNRRPLLLVLLGPLAFALVAAGMHAYPYGTSARFTLYMAPAFCLLAGVGFMSAIKTLCPRRKIFPCIGVIAGIMAVIAVGGTVHDLVQPYKAIWDEQTRQAVRWLVNQTHPDDVWISFNAADRKLTHADNLYQRGGSGARHRYYLQRLAPVPLHWAPLPDDVSGTPGANVWLIVFKDDRVPFPENLLDQYTRVLEKRWGEPRVRLFPIDHGKYSMEVVICRYAIPEGPQSRASAANTP